jgi:hypothetical protein
VRKCISSVVPSRTELLIKERFMVMLGPGHTAIREWAGSQLPTPSLLLAHVFPRPQCLPGTSATARNIRSHVKCPASYYLLALPWFIVNMDITRAPCHVWNTSTFPSRQRLWPWRQAVAWPAPVCPDVHTGHTMNLCPAPVLCMTKRYIAILLRPSISIEVLRWHHSSESGSRLA